MSVSADLLDIMEKYNWQIVDRQYIEVVPNERRPAWNDLFIAVLRHTPQTYRKNLRKGMIEHFDYKQPIVYDMKNRTMGVATQSVLDALNTPSKPMFDSKLISPLSVLTGFIVVVLSYLAVEGNMF
ncbi:pif-6 [Clostera anastomosis granulovirus B]|uniref:Pif-6 n=1 Tax=Clostera anastomosis granulovirus B TaxID=1986290 RepID=A0A0K0WSP2_9BBAC|nr:pif-6 [Clostera anastomosis granulovirus B]AKS25443.1 pif-6 [Clostera anastomosis granulovirus B]